jgi:predicted nucleic acid-binding protein
MIVVDASLGAKWFLDEAGSQEATELLVSQRRQIAAPDLFGIEVASALVRECNVRQDDASHFSWVLARLGALLDSGAVNLMRTNNQALATASSTAIDIGHPLKDCIYLILAMELDCDLVTCDARFANKAQDVWDRVRVLGVQ